MAAKPPVQESGRTFFVADAENGGVVQNRTPVGPWGWQVADYSTPGTPLVTNSTDRAKNGTRSYKFEILNTQAPGGHNTQVLSGGPQVPMSSPRGANGRYMGGYYSWWVYLDAGYDTNDWNMMLGWMTGVDGRPSPICYMGVRTFAGVRQVHFVLQSSINNGANIAPNIPNYQNVSNGNYFMTASSPAGIVPFPKGQWVHLVAYTNFQPTNGRIKIWQDGVLVMDLTAPTLNTWGGHDRTNTAGDMMIQFGIYEGQAGYSSPQRMYVDDFKVTDYRVLP
jgi:hypothetical protein